MNVARSVALATLIALSASLADAAPYVPPDDAIVLERLPEQLDPSLKELKRMRAALSANPRNVDVAATVAQRAIDAARANGDPRFLGQAQAALAPWWTDNDPPSLALLLRATVKQSQHDFDGSLADLDRVLGREPANRQALLTRATVLTVRGRYADAQRDCDRLAQLASTLIVATCRAAPRSLSGGADDAYRELTLALSRQRGSPSVRAWSLTLAAEIAARRGDAETADNHFQEALALDRRDAYLRAAYADFLLDGGRAREVLALTRDDVQNDSLLLRLALAEQALDDERDAFERHRVELVARFDAARKRGDALHQREEARFRLAVENDVSAALALARANWRVQREPADLRILAMAAHAANDLDAQKIVADWIAIHRLQDATIAAHGARR